MGQGELMEPQQQIQQPNLQMQLMEQIRERVVYLSHSFEKKRLSRSSSSNNRQ
jgi:hypothetical protein